MTGAVKLRMRCSGIDDYVPESASATADAAQATESEPPSSSSSTYPAHLRHQFPPASLVTTRRAQRIELVSQVLRGG